MEKLLIICGPTATGKTELALDLATQFSGEIVCADSRQVFIGMDIVTGKDIPSHFSKYESDLLWHDRKLSYYSDGNIRIWLTDVVNPDESFNVSFFNDCATKIITDIHSRGKLPIVVGVTGLYIKSLVMPMPDIHAPFSQTLRDNLADKSAEYLFSYLNQINPLRAAKLNYSDRWNPRRLIRAIEVSQSVTPITIWPVYDTLQIGLYGDRKQAYARINKRVEKRIAVGAETEVKNLLSNGYTWDMTSMRTSGNLVWQDYFAGNSSLDQLTSKWQFLEHSDYRQQEAWFKRQPNISWHSVDEANFKQQINYSIAGWYNNLNAKKD